MFPACMWPRGNSPQPCSTQKRPAVVALPRLHRRHSPPSDGEHTTSSSSYHGAGSDTKQSSAQTAGDTKQKVASKLQAFTENKDSLDAAAALRKKYPEHGDPLVLVFASALQFGGQYETTGNQQEEQIVRRCDISHRYWQGDTDAENIYYPLAAGSSAYYPMTVVFKTSNDSGYRLMPQKERFATALLFAPARRQKEAKTTLSEAEETETLNVMRDILHIAAINQHRLLVLGAWGCGGSKNPPGTMAKLWSAAL